MTFPMSFSNILIVIISPPSLALSVVFSLPSTVKVPLPFLSIPCFTALLSGSPSL